MTIIIKPTYNCNFRCKYCYLSNHTKNEGQIMDISLAELFFAQLREYVDARNVKKITIIWHGGEPLLWGEENFRTIFEYIDSSFKDVQHKNAIQTNLSLMSESYIDLFKEHDVHIGFSLDGDKSINDSQRVYKGNRGTFDDIINKLELCRSAGLSIGCIVVGSKKHLGRIKELYSFLCENHLNFKFNPLFVSGEAKSHINEYGLTAMEYADMAIELFDLWYHDNENELVESNFVEIASNLLSGKTSHCLFCRNCQDNFFAVSPNGDILPCGRFCDEEYKELSYGNISERSLFDILEGRKGYESYQRASFIEKSDCKKCEFYSICHGGCLHEGFLSSKDFKHKTFLCIAYKRIFKHIKQVLNA